MADGEPANPAERRRIDWIRRTARQPFGHSTADAPRLRVEVAVRAPADPDVAETRLLIDGRPLLPEAFGLFWPGLAEGQRDVDGPWLQFCWRLRDDDTPPEARAAAALTRLEKNDPKMFAQVRGGSREHAEALGLPWPEADRR
ncbi:hypothetical protein ABZ957_24305 [Streptomyces sp. NPDC046316]|uniref:hypothetical protein n=1 Tax=Streptomyces sp. NPDC046316 TaxID=3154494 RepID=UPI0033C0B0BA